jgi:tRNA(Arg) A34 adenosine deaminase TadA
VLSSSYMRVALSEACAAYKAGAVPVGAVVAYNGAIIARAHNGMALEYLALPPPLSHAEFIAMVMACDALRQTHLWGCEIYSTLEPCAMCFAAISQMKITKVFFGAYDPKSGLLSNTPQNPLALQYSQHPQHSQQSPPTLPGDMEIWGGFYEEKCSHLLSAFFKEKR